MSQTKVLIDDLSNRLNTYKNGDLPVMSAMQMISDIVDRADGPLAMIVAPVARVVEVWKRQDHPSIWSPEWMKRTDEAIDSAIALKMMHDVRLQYKAGHCSPEAGMECMENIVGTGVKYKTVTEIGSIIEEWGKQDNPDTLLDDVVWLERIIKVLDADVFDMAIRREIRVHLKDYMTGQMGERIALDVIGDVLEFHKGNTAESYLEIRRAYLHGETKGLPGSQTLQAVGGVVMKFTLTEQIGFTVDEELATQIARELEAEGVPSMHDRRGDRIRILVDPADKERASSIIESRLSIDEKVVQ